MEEKEVFLEKYVILSWLIALSLAITIFYVSSLTFGLGGAGGILSYLYHFFIFFWLSFFLSIAFTRARKISLIIPAIFISLFYAVSDEFHQLFIPGRAGSFGDFLIDSLGIFLAAFLYLWTVKIRKK